MFLWIFKLFGPIIRPIMKRLHRRGVRQQAMARLTMAASLVPVAHSIKKYEELSQAAQETPLERSMRLARAANDWPEYLEDPDAES